MDQETVVCQEGVDETTSRTRGKRVKRTCSDSGDTETHDSITAANAAVSHLVSGKRTKAISRCCSANETAGGSSATAFGDVWEWLDAADRRKMFGTSRSRRAPFDGLNVEVLQKIFSYLSNQEVRQASAVCSSWRKALDTRRTFALGQNGMEPIDDDRGPNEDDTCRPAKKARTVPNPFV